MTVRPGTWKNNKRTVNGWWSYQWAQDTFLIELDQRDRTTGMTKTFRVKGSDTPEWGNWKLVRAEEPRP